MGRSNRVQATNFLHLVKADRRSRNRHGSSYGSEDEVSDRPYFPCISSTVIGDLFN
jgi:hypothetical protein